MEEIIEKSDIQVGLHASNYKEAILLASSPLIEEKKITKRYAEMMIESLETLGPYIVLMPGFALAHSAPCEEVKENCLSIAIFDEGIDFKSDKGLVRVVMVLASTDGESHVEKLSKIASKLMNDDYFITKLVDCTDKEEVYNLLNK
ncbi:MAG: PTS sugar transporter subunit IIA [Solobacterium sp.]|nr:PTS sugar transporter subunit IIA [Solobacterium sp.]MDY2953180.1 PTS sugar transporter subunit IIA [Erysipelotrichaceae bacterium]MCI6845745.1 PTS sugar transporter subunit IIA [Solobacterium sp.]MCI6877321.1 PTS sugar transporter subunit IIA [Solobacterium sp.]MCI7156618.1 PTS sugar transporter subunit IIA [Solobacterium sp.]